MEHWGGGGGGGGGFGTRPRGGGGGGGLCVSVFGGGVPSRLNEYTGLYFQVFVCVHLLKRESSASLANLNSGGKLFLPGERGNSYCSAHKCCFCPLGSLTCRRRQCSTQSLSQDSGVYVWWWGGDFVHTAV